MYKTVTEAVDIFAGLSSTDIFRVVEKRHGRAITGTKWDIVLAILEDDAKYNGDVAHYPVDDADVSAWAIVEFAYNAEAITEFAYNGMTADEYAECMNS